MTKITLIVGLIAATMLALLTGCAQQSDSFQPDFGFDYFPLQTDRQVVYQVDSVVYDPVDNQTVRDSSTTFVKEVVGGQFIDDSGAEVFRIERWFRSAQDLPWVLGQVWAAQRDSLRALRQEDNLTFVKMVFPLQKGQKWNPTILFDPAIVVEIAGERMEIFKNWSSKTLQINQPERIGNFDFPQVLAISHAAEDNLIELRQVTEKYARGVGLVYREAKILDTQCIEPCRGKSWEDKAERGFICRQVVLEYSN